MADFSTTVSAAPGASDPLAQPGAELATELDATLAADLDAKLAGLRNYLESLGAVVVAFSGGADSALLAHVAHEQLGSNATVVTAVSPSLASTELDDCRRLAAQWGVELTTVETAEMERAAYRRNDPDRCYHCKAELMSVVSPIAAATDATIVLGVNTDDLDDHRPGQRAALEAGARFPFVELDISKADVRAMSRQLGLSTWDKPAAACLASRVPHGTEVTIELLSRVERAEAALRTFGFAQCRVRDHGDIARVEVERAVLADAVERRAEIVEALQRCGYRYVTLDLEGFRSGSLNPA